MGSSSSSGSIPDWCICPASGSGPGRVPHLAPSIRTLVGFTSTSSKDWLSTLSSCSFLAEGSLLLSSKSPLPSPSSSTVLAANLFASVCSSCALLASAPLPQTLPSSAHLVLSCLIEAALASPSSSVVPLFPGFFYYFSPRSSEQHAPSIVALQLGHQNSVRQSVLRCS